MISDSRVQSELDAGETLLWSGAPSPTSAASRGIVPSIVGVFMTGFALFWMSGAYWVTSQAPRGFGPPGASLFPLFGLIFVFAGLALVLTPFFNSAKATRTIYAVTDRRLLIIEGENVQSFLPADIERLQRRGESSGDVIFAREMRRGSKGRRYEVEIGFFGIQNPREVERLIRAHLKT
ncbi:hypothetical protein B1R32_10749 [Abditibacterium utsteinense]|uniref:Uncharacterized protein n=1 Tax=Abditibacterium utsteinense TaxID=1960156 RepID=A0A2S8ST93_9BACT|nr:hypothetical protein [Abditibacterium utsteinense]PQV64024.1 hypothetical protein B1R32_10749 [Abditibacterium utsteinense]